MEDKQLKVPNPPPLQNTNPVIGPTNIANGFFDHYSIPPGPPGYAPLPYGYPAYYPPYSHAHFIPPGVPPYPYHVAPQGNPYRPSTYSPGTTTSHNMSLSEFCAQFRISANDEAKLATLEYRPGHRGIERLEEKEWRDHGRFTRLGWEAFLDAHHKFCQAIKLRQV